MNPRKPRLPGRVPGESDDDYRDRLDDYLRELAEYDIACCEAVDAQRDREAMRGEEDER